MLKKIDRKILYQLDYDARQSFSQIARKVGTSKQVVGNHVHMLQEQGIIKKFLAVFDLSKLDLVLHKVYIRLIRASAKDEEDILAFFCAHTNVAWLARTEGVYDMALALHTQDVVELNQILLDMEQRFGTFISEKIVNRVITGEFFHRDYFLDTGDSGFRKNVVFDSLAKPNSIDATDMKILAALARDARTPAVDIAQHVPISADAVGKRIRGLEQTGVIKNYIVVLQDEKLHQLHYKVLLKVTNFTADTERTFLEFCRQHANIIFYNKGIGSWEIEVDMEVETSEKFRQIMRYMKQEFADCIKEYFSLIVYDVMKFDFLPMHKL